MAATQPSKKSLLGEKFLIGEELGRGAYGQVFKGMDTSTGDVVAIKQIGLSGVSQANLQGVMGEIDLLKTLNHNNIVKYIGSFKTRNHLYIILEFMENGALSSVIKPNRFGVFPETLVAIYIAQVLQGLTYLHDQGVVHRDIKGANILTTKDGLVKLADFGVAAKLGELDEQHCDELHQNVVGTPYWMAPEVIEMTQVTSASDIWSVGCLIIELLTGYPPYYDLQPMSALFRIVQDPHPPLPETISPLLEDFLLKCFQKDPSARPDARGLLQHEWVQFNRRTLRGTWSKSQGFKSRTAAGGPKTSDAHESVNSVVKRILQAEGSEDELATQRSSSEAQLATAAAVAGVGAAATAVAARPFGAATAGSRAGLSPAAGSSTVRQSSAAVHIIDASMGPLASDTTPRLALQQDTLLSASSLSGTTLQAAAGSRGDSGLLPTVEGAAAAEVQPRNMGSVELAQPGFTLALLNGAGSPAASPRSRLGPAQAGSLQQQQQQQHRLQQPNRVQHHQQEQQQDSSVQQGAAQDSASSPAAAAAGGWRAPMLYQGDQLQYGPGPSGRSSPLRPQVWGISPVPSADMDSPLGSLLARMQGDQSGAPFAAGGVPATPSAAAGAGGGLLGSAGSQSLMAWLDDGPTGGARNSSSLNGLGGPSRGQLLDGGLFGGLGLGGPSYLLHLPSADTLESASGQAQGGLETESTYLLEVKRKVRELVRSLRPLPGATTQQSAAGQMAAACALAGMFSRQQETRQFFLAEGGVLAALELLDADLARVAEAGLEVLRAFTASDTRLLESLCLVGLVPVVVRMAAAGGAVSSSGSVAWQQQQQLGSGGSYTSGVLGSSCSIGAGKDATGLGPTLSPGAAGICSSSSMMGVGALSLGGPPAHAGTSAEVTHLRKKAAGFVVQLCFAKETTLQMFIACGGLRCLVAMVQDNLSDCNTLTPVAVACIWQVLQTYGALPINYICRIFAAAGLIPRLYAVLKQLINLSRQQQQQQQHRVLGTQGSSGVGINQHFQHLTCPLTPQGLPFAPSDFFPLGVLGLGGRDVPAAGGEQGGSDAAGSASVAIPARLKGVGKASGPHKDSPVVEAGLAGTDELQQQQQHSRAVNLDDKQAAAAAGSRGAGGLQQQQQQQGTPQQVQQQSRAEWLQEHCLDLLLVLAHADSMVKAMMCSKDNLQHLLDLTQRLGPPGLIKAMKTIRWLSSEASVLPDIKNAGAISQLVPFLSREHEAVHGQAVVLEALQALYNICFFHKRVHLEVAATSGIVPHLCRFASEHVAAQAAAAPGGGALAGGGSNSSLPTVGDPLAQPGALSAAAAAEARRLAVRTYVVPLLIGLATTSSSTRAKLWASNGLDIFLQLLGIEDAQMQVGLMRTLDIWLSEDHSRVENRLCQREAVAQLVEVYSRLCRNATSVRSPVMPQMLDSLKVMLDGSSKVAVALAAGGLVPALLEPLAAAAGGPAARNTASSSSAPILRAKLLDIISIMYQHHPRPKEFIMKYRMQDVLLRLLESEGRGEDAVKVEAQKLLNAFHINVLL